MSQQTAEILAVANGVIPAMVLLPAVHGKSERILEVEPRAAVLLKRRG